MEESRHGKIGINKEHTEIIQLGRGERGKGKGTVGNGSKKLKRKQRERGMVLSREETKDKTGGGIWKERK